MADDVLHGAPQTAMLLTGQDRAALDEHGRAAEQRAVGRERGARVGRDGGERRRLDAAKAEVLAPDALVAGRLAGRGEVAALLADDDLFAMPGTWSKFFDRVAKYNARIAAPALTEDSFFSFGFTIRNTAFVARRVSYIEMMAPCFRIDTLTELAPTFGLATEMGNGWGLDYLWAQRLKHQDLFIIDETPVTHSRPGSFTPERFAAGQKELLRISGCSFGQWVQKSYAGIGKSGEEMRETDPRFLDLLMQGYRTLFERDCSGQNPVARQENNVRNHQRVRT